MLFRCDAMQCDGKCFKHERCWVECLSEFVNERMNEIMMWIYAIPKRDSDRNSFPCHFWEKKNNKNCLQPHSLSHPLVRTDLLWIRQANDSECILSLSMACAHMCTVYHICRQCHRCTLVQFPLCFQFSLHTNCVLVSVCLELYDYLPYAMLLFCNYAISLFVFAPIDKYIYIEDGTNITGPRYQLLFDSISTCENNLTFFGAHIHRERKIACTHICVYDVFQCLECSHTIRMPHQWT